MSSYRRRIVVDPVCEMDVVTSLAPCVSYSGRRLYYFCSPRCKMEFDLAPTFHLDRVSRRDLEARHRADRAPGRRGENRRRSLRLRTPLPA
jgi:YHS domain-containing protein